MRVGHRRTTLSLALLLAAGCTNDTIGPGEIKLSDLAGSWTVIQLLYTSTANPAAAVDLVANGTAAGTITVNANGAYTYLLTMAGTGTATLSGHFSLQNDQVMDTPSGQVAHPITASKQGDIVTLIDANATFDFDGNATTPPEPATLTTRWQKAP